MPKRSSKVETEQSPKQKSKKLDTDANGELSSLLTEPEWREVLKEEFCAPYFKNLEASLKTEFKNNEVFPPKEMIFNAFHKTPFSKVKVLILGQDPYHDNNQCKPVGATDVDLLNYALFESLKPETKAHGLCFSVQKGVPVPPSLKNMYKELENDIEGFVAPGHGNLEKWAEQGILLLNATLTVKAHEANSHAKLGWQTFTDAVIKRLSDKGDKIVYILWGGFAQKKEKLIDKQKHCIIKGAHPSPLSFNKFKGCKHFSQTNEALEGFGKQPIDWKLT